MVETIKYGLIGVEDMAVQANSTDTSFTVTLPDGTSVTINRIALDDFTAFGNVPINGNQLLNALLEITANPASPAQGRVWVVSDVIRYGSSANAVQEIVELDETQTLTNKQLTSPKIGTAITDTNGNEIIETPATASAVNHIGVVNSAAGQDVVIDARGTDTNIDVDIKAKGSGVVLLNGKQVIEVIAGTVQGDIIYHDGSSLTRLAAGTSGQFLKTQGASANPLWSNVGYADRLDLPRSYLTGLALGTGSDSDHDIDLQVGQARNSDDTENIILSASIIKQIDAAWVVGTNQGGLFSGTVAADTTYHFFVIKRTDTGVVDAGFDTSVTAANIPTNYDKFRRVGSLMTDSSSNIIAFKQTGDKFLLNVPANDFDTANPGTAAVTATVGSPGGVAMQALIAFDIIDTSSDAETSVLITALTQADTAPTATVYTVRCTIGASNLNMGNGVFLDVETNTSSQIRYRLSASNAGIQVKSTTHGWIDRRGRDD